MNEFEKYTKDTLNDYASPVDSERLWANIDRELRPGKRQLTPFWIWGLGLIVATGAMLLFVFINKKDISPALAEEQKVVAGKTGEKSEPFYSPRRHGGTKGEADHPSWQTPPPAPRPAVRDRPPLKERGGVMPPVEYATEHAAVHSTSPLPFRGGLSRTAGRGVGGGVSQAENHIQSLKLMALEPGAVDDDPNTTQTTDDQKLVSSLNRAVLSGRFVSPLLPTQLRELPATPPPPMPPSPKTGCSDWRKGPAFRPYFGLYGGAMYPLKSLDAKKTDFENIAAGRQETETVLEGIAAGAYIGMRHRSGLFAEAGLEYLRINERFDLTTVVTDTIGQVAVIGIIINAPGDTTFISDSVALLRETRFVKRTYNNYRFIQVPLAIGFEWRSGNSWSFYGKAGVSVNLRFGQKAEILNLTGMPEKYTSEKGGAGYPFRSKIGFSPFVNAGARYHLSPNLSLFGELRYLHQGGELTAEGYPLRQQYRLPGGNVGVHWQF